MPILSAQIPDETEGNYKGVYFKKYLRTLLLPFLVLINGFVFAVDNTLQLPTLSINSSNPNCGKNNGNIIASATQGIAPYTFQLNQGPPQTSGIFTRLGPGTYTITVTDAINQTSTASVTLANMFTPPTGVTAQYTLPSDCITDDATMTLTGNGGTPPYTFSIDRTNFQESNIFNNLGAGAYIIAVKDANGCMDPYLWWNTTKIPQSCSVMNTNGQNRSYHCSPFSSWLGLLEVTGGAAPYQYSLDGVNFQTNKDFYPLPAGLYTITVKDATGSLMKYSVAINDPCNPTPDISTLSQSANCGTSNGAIIASGSEGIAPYQYSIDGVNYQASGQFTGLSEGTYTITVKDANDQTSSKLVIVKASCLVLNATAISSTCNKPNGSISVQVSGGVPPYQYSADGIRYQASNILSNLSPGPYTVKVKDAAGGNGEFLIAVNNISGPVLHSIDATPTGCSGSTGAISAMVQGGTSPLQYSLNEGAYQSSSSFTKLSSGEYRLSVKDANGCLITNSVSVALNNDVVVDAGENVTICEGEKASLHATSNASTFSWTPTIGLSNATSSKQSVAPSITTTYTITAIQGACMRTDSVVVIVNKAPIATTAGDTSICLGNNLILSGSGGLTYVWSPANYLNDPSLPSPLFVSKLKGTFTYSLQVKDAAGCSSLNKAVSNVTVISPRIDVGRDTTIAANHPFQLTPTDPGSVGFIHYAWSPSDGLSNANTKAPIAILVQDATYTLTATTASGCVAMDAIQLKVYKGIDIYVPTAFTPNNDGRNDLLKAIPVGIKEFKIFSVFNRWGELVFQTTNPTKGWNGKVNGLLQPGVYVWYSEGIDYFGNRVRRKGTCALIQ